MPVAPTPASGQVSLLYHPAQEAFFAALGQRNAAGERAFNRLLLCSGRRGGKTVCGSLAVALFAAQPNQVIWATAPSFPKLHDYVLPALRASLPENWIVKWSENHQEFTLVNGTVIQCRSLDDPERGRGPGLDLLWMDEARDTPEQAWKTLLPALVDKKGVVVVTTSPNGYDWIHRTFWKPAVDGRPGYWAIRYKTEDNPALDPREIAEARAALDPEFARQEFDADFVHFTGAVFGDRIDGQVITAGNEALVIPEWPNIYATRPALCTIDPGVDHPFGAALAVMTEHGMVWVGEYLARHLPISEHVAAIKRMVGYLQPQYGYDRSARQVAIELAQHGIIAAPCENAVEAGIRRVQSWLQSGKMWFLESRVPGMIDQMRSYRWANNVSLDGQRRIKERVFKVDDEFPDCVRYATMLWPEMPEGPKKSEGRDLSTLPEDVRWAVEREMRINRWEPEPETGLGDFFM